MYTSAPHAALLVDEIELQHLTLSVAHLYKLIKQATAESCHVRFCKQDTVHSGGLKQLLTTAVSFIIQIRVICGRFDVPAQKNPRSTESNARLEAHAWGATPAPLHNAIICRPTSSSGVPAYTRTTLLA